jgi:hypothetical protein
MWAYEVRTGIQSMYSNSSEIQHLEYLALNALRLTEIWTKYGPCILTSFFLLPTDTHGPHSNSLNVYDWTQWTSGLQSAPPWLSPITPFLIRDYLRDRTRKGRMFKEFERCRWLPFCEQSSLFHVLGTGCTLSASGSLLASVQLQLLYQPTVTAGEQQVAALCCCCFCRPAGCPLSVWLVRAEL